MEQANVVPYWRRDRSDQQQDARHEEEEDSNPKHDSQHVKLQNCDRDILPVSTANEAHLCVRSDNPFTTTPVNE